MTRVRDTGAVLPVRAPDWTVDGAARPSYARFFVIGTALGVATVAAREVLGRLIPDTPLGYWSSVVIVYAAAMASGYRLQGRYAFGFDASYLTDRSGRRRFARFATVAATGSILTAALAVALRYGTPLGSLTASVAGAASFALAAVATSVVTFTLNRRYVFDASAVVSSAPACRNGETLGMTAFAVGFALLWTYFAGHDHNWDQLNYHLYAGLMATSDRFGQDFFAASIQSYLNPYSLLPFYLLFKAGWPALFVAVMLAVLHAVNLVLAHRISVALLPGDTNAWLRVCGVLMAAAAPIFLVELGTTFNDAIVSVPLLAALLQLLKADESRLRPLFAAGLFAGVAAALKLTQAPFLLACGLGALVLCRSPRSAARSMGVFGAGAAIGLTLAGGYWAYRLWREFGNPVFPFFNGIFASPDFAPVSVKHARFLGDDLFDALALPFRMADPRTGVYSETSAPDVRFAIALLLTVWLVVVSARSAAKPVGANGEATSRRVLPLVVAFWCGFAAWAVVSANGRYLMPLALACGPILVWLIATVVQSRRARVCILAGIFATQGMGIVLAADARWSTVPWSDAGWFAISVPQGFQQRKALYLSLDHQPAAFLAAFAAPQAGFVNVVGQNALAPDGPGGARVARLIDAHRDAVWIVLRVPVLDVDLRPVLPRTDRIDSLLEPFGLRSRPAACEYARLDGLRSLTTTRDDAGRQHFRHQAPHTLFAICPTEHVAPSDRWRAERDAAAARFAALEAHCPALFDPGTTLPVRRGDEWTKFYVNTDVHLSLKESTFRVSGYHIPADSHRFTDRFDCPHRRGSHQ